MSDGTSTERRWLPHPFWIVFAVEAAVIVLAAYTGHGS